MTYAVGDERPRQVRRDPPRIAGRQQEAAQIRAALDAVEHHGSGRFVLVHGESGVGKSAIAEWATFEASRRDWLVAATVCEPFHEGMSFFPVRELMRQLTAGRSVVQELTHLHGKDSVAVAMAMLADNDQVDPTARRDALLATFANVAIAATTRNDHTPVLLFVDDLERIDAGTTDGLLCLLARVAEAPIVVVGTYRDDVVSTRRTSHPLTPLLVAARRAGERVLDLTVGPIARSEVRNVVESVLGGRAAVARSFLDRLWSETEGNPLYLREVLRSLQNVRVGDGARLARGDGGWELIGDVTAWQTPATVEEAIRGRLDLMEPTSRAELEKASVIGRRFAFAVMMQLSESDEDGLIARLEECVSLSLIAEIGGDEDAFEFTHGKIRDVLYDSMSRIRRRRLHSTVADALSEMRGVVTEDWEGLIGEHLYQAGRYAEAVPLLCAAADRMLRVSAANDAAGLLEKAVTALERADVALKNPTELRLTWVRALVAANRYEQALDIAKRVTASPVADELSRGWAHDFIGDIHWTTGRRQAALEAYACAEDIALSVGDTALELDVCADLAELCDRASEQLAGVDEPAADQFAARSELYLARQVALAAQSTDQVAKARALRNEAKQLRRRGELEGAISRYEEALSLTDSRVATHSVLISYAKTLRFAGRIDEAVAVVDRVLAWSVQSGARRSLGIALHYRAILVFEREGAVEAVRRDLDEALLIHREIEYERGLWEVQTLMGEWWAVAGDRNEALACFRQVLKVNASLADGEIVDAIYDQLTAIDEHQRAGRLLEAWSRRGD